MGDACVARVVSSGLTAHTGDAGVAHTRLNE